MSDFYIVVDSYVEGFERGCRIAFYIAGALAFAKYLGGG